MFVWREKINRVFCINYVIGYIFNSPVTFALVHTFQILHQYIFIDAITSPGVTNEMCQANIFFILSSSGHGPGPGHYPK